MVLLTELLFTLLVSVLITQFIRQRWAMRKLPPGPVPLPFLGNLWALNFQLDHETLIQMGKVYGNIFTVWLGGTPFIIIDGFQAVHNALISHSEELSGRPSTPFFEDTLGNRGILFSNGHTWRQQRRFGMMTMRNLGLGKKSLESNIQDVAQQLLEHFSLEKGKPMDAMPLIVNCISNVISSVVFGHCFSFNDASFHQLMQASNLMTDARNQFWATLYDAFPFIMRRLMSRKKMFVEWEKVRQYIKKEIRMHRDNAPEEPQDFIDYYLKQISQTKGDVNSTYEEENLMQVVAELFFAGSETTATTLRWALIFMANRPEVQEKIQRELDEVLGDSNIIQYEDRKRVPYTNAVIHEIGRYANIVPVGGLRECIKDTNLQGFLLEKGTAVLPNLSSVLFDPEIWETPRQFNPDHFLDKEGNFLSKEAFLPFGAGHRVCFGEQLARTEFFIFFASMLRTFTLHPPEGLKKLNEDYILKSTCQPHPYRICAIPR